MSRRISLVLCAVVCLTASRLTAQVPGENPPQAQPPAGSAAAAVAHDSCAPQLVTRTIMVPQISYKTITVPVVVIKPQVKQKTITVYHDVPETRQVTRMVPVLVHEKRTFTEHYTACRYTWHNVSRDIVVMQMATEVHEGTRTVCQPIVVPDTRTICQDLGGWSAKTWVDAHGCQQSCRVWVPKIVQQEVPVLVRKMQVSEVPYRVQVPVCRPVNKTITERICTPVYEPKSREVTRTVCVEKLVEHQFTECIGCRQVAEQRVVNCLVPIAVTEQREITVPVCTLVPRQVTCSLAHCGPCGY